MNFLFVFCSLIRNFDPRYETFANHSCADGHTKWHGADTACHEVVLQPKGTIFRRVAAHWQRQVRRIGVGWGRHLPHPSERHYVLDWQTRQPPRRGWRRQVDSRNPQGAVCRRLCPCRLPATACRRTQLGVLPTLGYPVYH